MRVPRVRRLTTAMAIACAMAAVLVPAAQARPVPVPPKDCGFMTVREQRYNVRSDQLRCPTSRRYAKRYLRTDERPRGWRCTNYGRQTAIDFRCTKGSAVFFAIRR